MHWLNLAVLIFGVSSSHVHAAGWSFWKSKPAPAPPPVYAPAETPAPTAAAPAPEQLEGPFNKELIFRGDADHITLRAIDKGSSIPFLGSSMLDKLFSKPGPDGEPVYDIPYPYDRFIDSLAGRPQPVPRLLTRMRSLKTVDSLLRFLETDLFIRAPEEIQDQESLFPFGRSLQKPREGNAIVNPWVSPREVVTMNLPREPHLQTVGPIKSRLYCGHVEDLHSMECISWNDEAGRFEFQVVEDYGGPNQRVRYVNRSKCLACHQSGAPIFPKLDWLESDDSLALEPGLILSNYAGNRNELKARSADIEKSVNRRLLISKTERQRQFVNGGTERFRLIKAGKFDLSVHESTKMMEANKLWIHFCGPTEAGDSCRKLIFKTYLVWASQAQDSDPNNTNRADSAAISYLTFGMTPDILKAMRDGLAKVQSARIFSPFIFDRDPLTAHFENGEIDDCLSGSCDWDFMQQLISPQAAKEMIKQGQSINSFFNPRALREFPLTKETQVDRIALELAKDLALFFYSGKTSFAKGDEITSDFGDWIQKQVSLGTLFNRKTPSKEYSTALQFTSNAGLAKLIDRVEQMDHRYFGGVPIRRERILFGLWEGLDDQKAMEYYQILTRPTPKKEMAEVPKPFQVDQTQEPVLGLITKVCAECHGTGRGKSNIPQFAFAETRSELLSNVFYHRREMINQLTQKNMPPDEAMESLSDTERADLISYLQKMTVDSK